MKVSCEVIKDLIPLYLEDLLSEESRKFVEEHLDECPEQKAYVEKMRKEGETSNNKLKGGGNGLDIEAQNKVELNGQTPQANSGGRVINKFRKNMASLIIKIVALAVALVFAGFNIRDILIKDKSLSYEESKLRIVQLDEKIVLSHPENVTVSKIRVNGWGGNGVNKGESVAIVICNRNDIDSDKIIVKDYAPLLVGGKKHQFEGKTHYDAIYYMDQINGKLVNMYGNTSHEKELDLNIFLTNSMIFRRAVLIAFVVSIILYKFVKDKKFIGDILMAVNIYCISYCISYIIFKLSSREYYGVGNFGIQNGIIELSIPIFIILLMINLIRRQVK